MRTLSILAVLLVLVSSGTAQQPGRHGGALLGLASLFPSSVSTLVQLDSGGSPTIFSTSRQGAWPHYSNHYGMTLDADNRTVLVPAYLNATGTQMAVVRWDPATRSVVGTVWTAAATFGSWSNWTLNSDGDLVTVDWRARPFALTVHDRFNQTTRRLTVPNWAGDGLGGLTWDKARGGYLFCGVPSAAANLVLARTTYDGSATSTVAVGSSSMSVGFGGDLLGNGDWVVSAVPNPAGVPFYVARSGQSTFSNGPIRPPLAGVDDLTAEKWAAPGHGVFGAQGSLLLPSGTGVYYFDPTTSPMAVTTVWAAPKSQWPAGTIGGEITMLYQRDLTTMRTGKATWSIRVNPGNGAFAGKSYVVAASLSGARPAAALPDGRQVYLVPDAVTRLSLLGGLAPFLTGNQGTLDHQGQAGARLDFSLAGTNLNGLVIHLCGLIVDPTAPYGTAWILEPWAFVVNVLP